MQQTKDQKEKQDPIQATPRLILRDGIIPRARRLFDRDPTDEQRPACDSFDGTCMHSTKAKPKDKRDSKTKPKLANNINGEGVGGPTCRAIEAEVEHPKDRSHRHKGTRQQNRPNVRCLCLDFRHFGIGIVHACTAFFVLLDRSGTRSAFRSKLNPNTLPLKAHSAAFPISVQGLR